MIDIIIPAYNAFDTIKNAIISICMQTICDKVNVYIINDASNGDYSDIIELFKSRLNIFEINIDVNSGPGVARQVGIDNSFSDYIMFLDSDDVLYNKFSLEKLYSMINDCDLVVGSMIDEREHGFYYFNNHVGCLHGKLYSRKFINKYKLRFNDTRSSEDNGFNRLYLLAEPRVNYVKEEVYLYRYNVNSLTNNSVKFDDLKWYIYNVDWVIDNAISRNFSTYLTVRYAFSSIVYVYTVYVCNIKNKRINIILDWMKNLVSYYISNESLLNDSDKLELYREYNCDAIPCISLIQFINMCKQIKNS